ncbi:MAG: hypothetical protein ACRDHH_04520 [Actinomycetota bacterium]
MTPRRTLVRLMLVASLAAAGLVSSASPAPAAFHFSKVVEVFAGTAIEANADFVELQMYEPGQNLVGGHTLHLYIPPTYPGEPFSRQDCTIPTNVPVGADQSHILFATTEAQSLFITADFTMPPLLSGDGGAVCFENIDCVAWGSFSGSTTSPAGTPEPAIPPDQSIHRSIAAGDATKLEAVDDTNDSAADFAPADRDPTANGLANLGTLNCQAGTGPGPGGSAYDLQGLKVKVKGGRAIIRGTVQPPAPGDKVKLTFYANGSPLRKVAAKSATLSADSKFKKRFKVPGESTRCKVVVRFKGAKLGQRKFKC